MNVFTSKTNLVTGKTDWVVENDGHDYFQDIARSAYADMLHDTERNKKYYAALRKAVHELKMCNKEVHVLDIGAGTGLLSMMAVTCGADRVTACEAFEPMADIAKQVLSDNNMSGLVHLIDKRSTELTVGLAGDLPCKANVLVTEVFDTELIGEGAIGTFRHAHQHLLEEDCIVVPSAANLYIQVVSSDFLRNWNQFYPVSLPNGDTIEVPPKISSCAGAPSVHDLQLTQLEENDFRPLSQPIRVFYFDWSGKTPLPLTDSHSVTVHATSSGDADAVLMWWDLEMDVQGDIILSCAPSWAHPDYKSERADLPWRDHWMQAVYYPPTQQYLKQDEDFTIHSYHDDYSLWFDICLPAPRVISDHQQAPSPSPDVTSTRPCCECGAHLACSRTRLAMLNDASRNEQFMQALTQVVKPDSVCLCLSDCSLLPIMAAKLGAKQVFSIERHSSSARLLQQFVEYNGLSDTVHIIEKDPGEIGSDDFLELQPDVLLGEPFFSASVLPWHNLYFWYARTTLSPLLSCDLVSLPCSATLKAMAVNFTDLWKIRAPVGICEGFDLTHFDNAIRAASDLVDEDIEPQPLWEYPCMSVCDQFVLMTFDLSKTLKGVKSIRREGFEEVWSTGTCNAIVVWMDYELIPGVTISSGPKLPPKPNTFISWPSHTRQGVRLLKTPAQVINYPRRWNVRYCVEYKPTAGTFNLDFKVSNR